MLQIRIYLSTASTVVTQHSEQYIILCKTNGGTKAKVQVGLQAVFCCSVNVELYWRSTFSLPSWASHGAAMLICPKLTNETEKRLAHDTFNTFAMKLKKIGSWHIQYFCHILVLFMTSLSDTDCWAQCGSTQGHVFATFKPWSLTQNVFSLTFDRKSIINVGYFWNNTCTITFWVMLFIVLNDSVLIINLWCWSLMLMLIINADLHHISKSLLSVHMRAYKHTHTHACMCESVCACVCVCAFMLYALNFDNMYL